MSEVVSVVLLVAIVVVLAGTVAVFVTGIDSERQTPPQFAKVEDYNRSTDEPGQVLEVEHGSGEIFETGNLRVVVTGAVVRDSSDTRQGDAVLDENITDQIGDTWEVSESVVFDQNTMTEEGDSIGSDEYLDLREAKIEIVWVPENEGTSDVLYRWEGPDR